MRTQLDQIPFFALIEKSAKLSEHFFSQLVAPAQRHLAQKYIVSFYPFETEPQINIEDEARREPFRVAYVRIDNWDLRQMSASAARRDQPGEWEDIEPKPQVRIFQPHVGQPVCAVSEVAMILVPGLAFTQQGYRLGRGAGFYDRFLTQYPQALRVGIAFSEQIVHEVPYEPFDQPLDIVLTDETVFKTNRFSEWLNHGKILDRNS